MSNVNFYFRPCTESDDGASDVVMSCTLDSEDDDSTCILDEMELTGTEKEPALSPMSGATNFG